jgi:hypothetical protein
MWDDEATAAKGEQTMKAKNYTTSLVFADWLAV